MRRNDNDAHAVKRSVRALNTSVLTNDEGGLIISHQSSHRIENKRTNVRSIQGRQVWDDIVLEIKFIRFDDRLELDLISKPKLGLPLI